MGVAYFLLEMQLYLLWVSWQPQSTDVAVARANCQFNLLFPIIFFSSLVYILY